MKKEVLSEIDQMKYLFGYKPGKVISEQVTPAPEIPANAPQVLKLIFDMVNNKTPYLYSELIPGKIIFQPRIQFGEYGPEIYYIEVAPSDGVVQGMNRSYSTTAGGDVKTMEQLGNLINTNKVTLRKTDNWKTTQTPPFSNLDIMYSVGGEKNPQAFVEFLQKNFGDKAKQTLMDQLQKRANSPTKDYDPTPAEARDLLMKLNPQTQTAPTK